MDGPSPRALPKLIADTVQTNAECGGIAYALGYAYFGTQYGGGEAAGRNDALIG
jgi:hypothetical protein